MTTVNRLGIHLGNVERHLDEVSANTSQLMEDVAQLKEIIDKMLMSRNPEYKRYKVLSETDDFLRKRSGRSRSAVNNQE